MSWETHNWDSETENFWDDFECGIACLEEPKERLEIERYHGNSKSVLSYAQQRVMHGNSVIVSDEIYNFEDNAHYKTGEMRYDMYDIDKMADFEYMKSLFPKQNKDK